MAFRIYLTGHRSFANHGCEALVRSAVALFREAFGATEFLVPSADPAEDRRFWPDAAEHGVTFVAPPDPWAGHLWWERAVKRIPGWKSLPWPPAPLSRNTRDAVERADMVIATGGDNYTLDYDLVSLYTIMGVDKAAMDKGVPTVLWGCSAGPFDEKPEVVAPVRKHMARFDAIVARETMTHSYLTSMGLGERLSLACDPAFLMVPEPIDLKAFWPKEGEAGTIALNLSPLIRRYHAAGNAGVSLEDEVVAFVQDLAAQGYGVLLLPHVVGSGGATARCDHAYLTTLLARTGTADGRIALAPRTLNAPQLKFALSRCRYVMAARTHATIGAMSCGVPTLSIAYSVKAKGINRDLFGDTRYVLDGAAMNRSTLAESLERLRTDEEDIRRTLAARKQEWPASMERALTRLKQGLAERPRASGRAVTAAANR